MIDKVYFFLINKPGIMTKPSLMIKLLYFFYILFKI